MVRLPTPAAFATSSIVVFEYPRTPISRSAASRIRSRVPVGVMGGSLLGYAILHDFGFSCKHFLGPLAPSRSRHTSPRSHTPREAAATFFFQSAAPCQLNR